MNSTDHLQPINLSKQDFPTTSKPYIHTIDGNTTHSRPVPNICLNLATFHPHHQNDAWQHINSLWPSDAIWQGYRSTLVQVMDQCPAMFIWGQFRLRYHSHQPLKFAWKLLFPRFYWNPPGDNEFKKASTMTYNRHDSNLIAMAFYCVYSQMYVHVGGLCLIVVILPVLSDFMRFIYQDPSGSLLWHTDNRIICPVYVK